MQVSFRQLTKAIHHKLFAQECLAKHITPAWLRIDIEPHFSEDMGETKATSKSYVKEFTKKTLELSANHYRTLCRKERDTILLQREKCQAIVNDPTLTDEERQQLMSYLQTRCRHTLEMQQYSQKHSPPGGRRKSTQPKNGGWILMRLNHQTQPRQPSLRYHKQATETAGKDGEAAEHTLPIKLSGPPSTEGERWTQRQRPQLLRRIKTSHSHRYRHNNGYAMEAHCLLEDE